ncbi:uncharacterized protein LOC118187271 [Stegodyphus dumicola]|uniref:uncharacterized protein LOC118187271 n=1 Tax=Stegodyphus dumicola TaxID=202533 RepID=UPI0015A7A638|nr:uncharacterized protein LOC118187271 [Stegodyphus dumicola]
MYVDDLVTGADDVSEALKTSREAKEIMRGAGMNLRKWVTNDYHLAKKWEEENFDIHPLSSNEKILKVLGIQWNIQEDSLSIETSCLTKISRRKKSTKRFILQTAGKIYDPLGLITPFTVRIKLLLQKLWLRKLPWDSELPSDLNDEWSRWCSELSELSNISVPRFVLDSSDENIEIHVFSDASQKSYGAAVYIKVQNREKNFCALIAAKLGTEVKKVLDRKGSSNIFFWSDSKVTLYWIKGSSRRWKTFVQNRVDEIQKLTNPDSWFYCSTKDNPADLLTRGVSASSLVNNSKWWTCAEFFTEPNLPYKCLEPIVPEVENLTPSERESFVQESKSLSDINDISERTMFICNCRKGESRKVGPLQLEEVQGIENAVSAALTENIKSAIAEASDTKPLKDNSLRLPNYIRIKIRQSNRMRKSYHVTWDPRMKRKINKLNKETQKDIKNYREELWCEKLINIDTRDGSLWTIIKNLKFHYTTNRPLTHNGALAVTHQDKANVFATYLEEQFTSNEWPNNFEHNFEITLTLNIAH